MYKLILIDIEFIEYVRTVSENEMYEHNRHCLTYFKIGIYRYTLLHHIIYLRVRFKLECNTFITQCFCLK